MRQPSNLKPSVLSFAAGKREAEDHPSTNQQETYPIQPRKRESHMQKGNWQILACVLFVALACLSATAQLPSTPPDHVVIVIEENHSFAEIIGSSSAPYINSLAQQGALFTHFFDIEHPSELTSLDLFASAKPGITSDACPAGPFSTD